ncbi:hypothetical protein CULT_690034 [[Clostridium] ultunense Esp]|nr:hypothetical protein CULT_690034 [[Clostridium] ultunense Esp]
MEESLKGMLLGSIQGLTEFLPISSTGHLVLARRWLGLSEAGLLFDTLMHLGTFFAVLAVFLREIKEVLFHPFSPLTKLLAAGTLPTALIGFLFADFFDRIAVTGESLGWEFLLTGGILWAADHLRERGKREWRRWESWMPFGSGHCRGRPSFPPSPVRDLPWQALYLSAWKRKKRPAFPFSSLSPPF